MSKIKTFLQTVLDQALEELREKNIFVYTFAFYHDHESKAVSVCVDTEENSKISVLKQNEYRKKYFNDAIQKKDLVSVALWNANSGRNLSLGDFTFVNLAYTYLNTLKGGKLLYLGMIEILIENQKRIAALSEAKDKILFLASGPDYEVQYSWTL